MIDKYPKLEAAKVEIDKMAESFESELKEKWQSIKDKTDEIWKGPEKAWNLNMLRKKMCEMGENTMATLHNLNIVITNIEDSWEAGMSNNPNFKPAEIKIFELRPFDKSSLAEYIFDDKEITELKDEKGTIISNIFAEIDKYKDVINNTTTKLKDLYSEYLEETITKLENMEGGKALKNNLKEDYDSAVNYAQQLLTAFDDYKDALKKQIDNSDNITTNITNSAKKNLDTIKENAKSTIDKLKNWGTKN